uniref:Ig-like domain-containing protein n=1 Tax=Globodera rostochiensis TaxID=31243 RepID=A0A914H3U0_GLORO
MCLIDQNCPFVVPILLIIVIFLLSQPWPVTMGRGDPVSDTQILSTLLNRGYDWRVRPPGTNLSIQGDHGPVVVYVNMLIRSISKIDDVNMEYSAQLTFRETWVDGRLAYGLPRDGKPDHIILTAGQQIWMPDSFFQNEKMARKHEIDKPNVLIRVHKDGLILYSVRISLVLSCPMHLQYYPMDVQTCLIDLASYAYTDSDIEYRWKEQDPVQLKDGLESSLPSFQLTNVSTTSCTSNTNTGTYSCLRTVLTLKRQFSYYLLQLYIPSTMLVIVSWVSFWLDRTAVPARVTLGVTTLLTMTTQTSGINAKLPPVSYSKAIDIWCGACLAFIFSALLEFACVTYISSRMFYKRMRPSVGPGSGLSLSLGCTGVPKLATARLITGSGRPSICGRCRGLSSPPPPPSAATESALLAHQWTSMAQTVQPNWDPEQPDDDEEDDVWVRRKDATVATKANCSPSSSPPPPLQIKIDASPMARSKQDALLEQELHLLRFNNGSAADRLRSERLKRGGMNPFVEIMKRLPLIRWICRRMEVEDPAKKADYVSRILFPLAFALFNLAYWLRYLKCLALVSVVGEESMEQELRPPEEGVDICVSQSELLNKLSGTVRIVHVCPASNQFWYYNCCGEYGDICCFQLQPMSWLILGFLVPVAIGLLALQLLCGLFSNLFKLCCICCCRNPKEMMPTHRHQDHISSSYLNVRYTSFQCPHFRDAHFSAHTSVPVHFSASTLQCRYTSKKMLALKCTGTEVCVSEVWALKRSPP